MSRSIREAVKFPIIEPVPFISFSPVTLSSPDRVVNLELRVSAPVTGRNLPLILLSHGHGSSNNLSSSKGCAPLAEFWAAHGFVVVQPTHLNSKTISIDRRAPEAPLFWKSRAKDMRHILNRLDSVEAIVPGLTGRVDRSRIAVAGFSLGGHTAGMLLGMRPTDPDDGTDVDMADARIKAGVLLCAPGGGTDLSAAAAERYPVFCNSDFSRMTPPALVVLGENDINLNFSNRTNWRADAYHQSPGPKSMLTVSGAQHTLGGISGYDAAETTDENPERVAAVQHLTWAYLRSALYINDDAWNLACAVLAEIPDSIGRLESK